MEETLDRYDATVAAYGSGWVGGWVESDEGRRVVYKSYRN